MKPQPTMAIRRLALCAVPLVLVSSFGTAPARAQRAATPIQTQSPPSTQETFSEGQIEQLVAPIALYPDPLLSQVLMASTYPLEVVEAARWSRDNPNTEGQGLQSAMQSQSWDPSVKALTAVPQTLEMMNDKLSWTQQLGDAFLAQQQDVLNAVQKLRAEAQAAGNLQSTPQQVVTTAPPPSGVVASGGPEPITIEPANPNVYYVPVYDPAAAYGTWDYPNYLPFYWSPPGFVASNIVSFGAGVAVGAAIWGGCNWWRNNVFINVNNYNIFNHMNINAANISWMHNPAHRHGVPYPNAMLAERFGHGNEAAARDAFRERADTPNDHLFGDRGDVSRPDASRPWGGYAGDASRKISPAFPAGRDGDFARDRADARQPDGLRPFEGRAEDAARRTSPAFPDSRDGDARRNEGERAIGRATAGRRKFDVPHGDSGRETMRSRAQIFRPEQRFMGGGGFHRFGGGSFHRFGRDRHWL